MKYGFFTNAAVERLHFINGKGQQVQSGGYKVRDEHQFGYNMTDFISGSYYSLGLIFEVVLTC